jgi:hypothetical protein
MRKQKTRDDLAPEVERPAFADRHVPWLSDEDVEEAAERDAAESFNRHRHLLHQTPELRKRA